MADALPQDGSAGASRKIGGIADAPAGVRSTSAQLYDTGIHLAEHVQ